MKSHQWQLIEQEDATKECWKCSACGGIKSYNVDDSDFRKRMDDATAFLDWTVSINHTKEKEFVDLMKESRILTEQDFYMSLSGMRMALHGVLADRCDVAREFVAYFVTEV